MPGRLSRRASRSRGPSPAAVASSASSLNGNTILLSTVERRVPTVSSVAWNRSLPLIPDSLRHDMICEAAYFRAQARGFAPGGELEDWLAAEQEVEELICRRYAR